MVPEATSAVFSRSSFSEGLPSLDELVARGVFSDFIPLLPARLITVPRPPGGRGHRVRHRWKCAREKVLLANSFLRHVNSLNAGLHANRACRPSTPTEATLRLHRLCLEHAATAVMARRALSCSGAQSAEKLMKTERTDKYCFALKTHNQCDLLGDALDEPKPGSPFVDMISALPDDEAEFYSTESNVVEMTGKSQVLFDEVQRRYAFVSGSYDEYTRYFCRSDVDPDLWRFHTADEIKCVSGFASVLKKDPAKQRKLLMLCPVNYLWSSAKERSSLGMGGGAALNTVFSTTGECHLAGWDESNAFTSVRTPK